MQKAVHEHPVFGALLGNSALGVEVFLVLSGLLAARTWQRDAQMDFWVSSSLFLSKSPVFKFCRKKSKI